MFSRILVPLDGSRMAEAALPAAEALRRAFSSSVTLIHVLESGPPREAHGERHLQDKQEAEAYLAEAAARYFPPDVNIALHVHAEGISTVPESLTEHSQELEQDLIIMCVHGRGGFDRMVGGSLAERIMSTQTVPVLLVRAGLGGPIAPSFRLVLVALDGKADHEQGLVAAEELARKTGARLLLVSIVPTWFTLRGEGRETGRLLPAATAELLAQTESSAERYLQEHAERLRADGIQVETAIRHGNPPKQITRFARLTGSDLIVLGTHGRTGARAFWAGSIGYLIVGRTATPILLIPAAEKRK